MGFKPREVQNLSSHAQIIRFPSFLAQTGPFLQFSGFSIPPPPSGSLWEPPGAAGSLREPPGASGRPERGKRGKRLPGPAAPVGRVRFRVFPLYRDDRGAEPPRLGNAPSGAGWPRATIEIPLRGRCYSLPDNQWDEAPSVVGGCRASRAGGNLGFRV